MHAYRSHTCAALTKSHVGQNVRLSGWVHRVRDHGGILFIDLRDHYGVTQVLCDPDSPVFKEVEKVRSEWCIRIDGEVKARDADLVNPKLPTGEIEVFVRDIEILGAASELPLMVFGDQEYPEETRLRYRYLDLRRETMQENMKLRSDVVASIRRRMWDKGFREYQTPIITASSPEGARDFLVPSRLHPGKFYALPQAPQQFKQLIMVSGFDKYFQIAPCFRDEDPRADRSPTDFYQLDMEMSFVTQQDVFDTVSPVIAGIFEEFGSGKSVDAPAEWPQISYRDAALWYGTDKPDLRNPIKMQVVSEHFAGSGFAIFAKLLEQEGTEIRAIPAPTGGSRKFCDRMNAFAQKEGLPGMGYIFWRAAEDGSGMEAAGPLAKNIGPERTEAIRQQLGLGLGDAAFFLGGKPATFRRGDRADFRAILLQKLGEHGKARTREMLTHNLHLDGVAEVRLVGAVPECGVLISDLRPVLRRIHLTAAAELLKHTCQNRPDRVEHVLLADKAHFQVELVEVRRRTVRTRVFVAEAGRDLEILVIARDHDQLLELLRCLRQRIELAGMQARRHEEVACALRRRGRNDRRLVFAEILAPHALAHRAHHIRAQRHIALHILAAQVEEAIAQAGFLGVFLIPEHHQRQFLGCAQHFHIAHEHFDLARGELRVHQFRITRLHHAVNADTPFRTHLFHVLEHRAVGVAQDLGHAVMVAQVDEQDATMVAHPVHPAREANGFTNMRGAQIGAGMAAIGMHRGISRRI